MGDNCGHHKNKKLRKLLKKIGIGISISMIVIGIIILILWLALRPSDPRFVLQDASLRALNVSSSSTSVTSVFQLTVQSHNPNDHVGIYYDRLLVYATYRTQPITLATAIPSTFQDSNGVNIWTPFVSGVQMPVAPYTGESLRQDQAGTLILDVIIAGRLRWRLGSFVSGSHSLHVNCPATFAAGNANGDGTTAVSRYQLAQSCSVSV